MKKYLKLGLLCVVFFMIGSIVTNQLNNKLINDNQEVKVKSNKIAIVNNDEAIITEDGTKISYSKPLINEIVENKDYNQYTFATVSNNEAEQGMVNGKYGAVITLPSNFSKTVFSINDVKPQVAKISYQINENLVENKKAEFTEDVLGIINHFTSNIRYMYTYNALNSIHATQEQLNVLLKNMQEIKKFTNDLKNFDEIGNHKLTMKELNDLELLGVDTQQDHSDINQAIENFLTEVANFEDPTTNFKIEKMDVPVANISPIDPITNDNRDELDQIAKLNSQLTDLKAENEELIAEKYNPNNIINQMNQIVKEDLNNQLIISDNEVNLNNVNEQLSTIDEEEITSDPTNKEYLSLINSRKDYYNAVNEINLCFNETNEDQVKRCIKRNEKNLTTTYGIYQQELAKFTDEQEYYEKLVNWTKNYAEGTEVIEEKNFDFALEVDTKLNVDNPKIVDNTITIKNIGNVPIDEFDVDFNILNKGYEREIINPQLVRGSNTVDLTNQLTNNGVLKDELILDKPLRKGSKIKIVYQTKLIGKNGNGYGVNVAAFGGGKTQMHVLDVPKISNSSKVIEIMADSKVELNENNHLIIKSKITNKTNEQFDDVEINQSITNNLINPQVIANNVQETNLKDGMVKTKKLTTLPQQFIVKPWSEYEFVLELEFSDFHQSTINGSYEITGLDHKYQGKYEGINYPQNPYLEISPLQEKYYQDQQGIIGLKIENNSAAKIKEEFEVNSNQDYFILNQNVSNVGKNKYKIELEPKTTIEIYLVLDIKENTKISVSDQNNKTDELKIKAENQSELNRLEFVENAQGKYEVHLKIENSKGTDIQNAVITTNNYLDLKKVDISTNIEEINSELTSKVQKTQKVKDFTPVVLKVEKDSLVINYLPAGKTIDITLVSDFNNVNNNSDVINWETNFQENKLVINKENFKPIITSEITKKEQMLTIDINTNQVEIIDNLRYILPGNNWNLMDVTSNQSVDYQKVGNEYQFKPISGHKYQFKGEVKGNKNEIVQKNYTKTGKEEDYQVFVSNNPVKKEPIEVEQMIYGLHQKPAYSSQMFEKVLILTNPNSQAAEVTYNDNIGSTNKLILNSVTATTLGGKPIGLNQNSGNYKLTIPSDETVIVTSKLQVSENIADTNSFLNIIRFAEVNPSDIPINTSKISSKIDFKKLDNLIIRTKYEEAIEDEIATPGEGLVFTSEIVNDEDIRFENLAIMFEAKNLNNLKVMEVLNENNEEIPFTLNGNGLNLKEPLEPGKKVKVKYLYQVTEDENASDVYLNVKVNYNGNKIAEKKTIIGFVSDLAGSIRNLLAENIGQNQNVKYYELLNTSKNTLKVINDFFANLNIEDLKVQVQSIKTNLEKIVNSSVAELNELKEDLMSNGILNFTCTGDNPACTLPEIARKIVGETEENNQKIDEKLTNSNQKIDSTLVNQQIFDFEVPVVNINEVLTTLKTDVNTYRRELETDITTNIKNYQTQLTEIQNLFTENYQSEIDMGQMTQESINQSLTSLVNSINKVNEENEKSLAEKEDGYQDNIDQIENYQSEIEGDQRLENKVSTFETKEDNRQVENTKIIDSTRMLLPNTTINGLPNKLVYNMFSDPIKPELIKNKEIFETISENKNAQLLFLIIGLIIITIAIVLIIKLFKKSNED